MKSFVVVLFLVPDLRVGDPAAAELDELNAVGLILNSGHVAAPNCQRQGDCNYHNGKQRQHNVHSGLPYPEWSSLAT